MGAQATVAYVDRAVCFPFIQFAGEMQESLVLYMEQRPESFWEDMPGDLKMCASEWYEKTKDNPNYLRQVLERWRAFS